LTAQDSLYDDQQHRNTAIPLTLHTPEIFYFL
jgi:hypothetical protein